jgi:enterochelin esterase-like enzyme
MSPSTLQLLSQDVLSARPASSLISSFLRQVRRFIIIGPLLPAVALAQSTSPAPQPPAPTQPAAATPSAATPRPQREVIWNNVPTTPHPLVSHHDFFSDAMQRTVGYTVYLPPSYSTDITRRLPVLYFLHGAGGNENADGPGFAGIVDRLIKAGRIPPTICVFPNGGMSGYRDHAETGINVETMLTKELLPLIDTTYRTLPQRESRVIGGFSMGGGGSLRLALTHPDLFSAAASWAGSVANRRTREVPPELNATTLRQQDPTVRLLMIVGYEDEIALAGHLPFIEVLREARYSFTFRTLRGVAHNLGSYYELTGEEFATFLLKDVFTEAR